MNNSPTLLTIPLNRPPLQPLNDYRLPLERAKNSIEPISPVTNAPDLSRKQSMLTQAAQEEDFQPIFNSLFTYLFPFEQNYIKLASKAYIIIASILLCILISLKDAFLQDLPYAQVSFTGILIMCLVNCLLVKVFSPGAGFTYKSQSSTLKKLIALIIGLPILLFHGLEFLDSSLAAGIMCSAFLIVLLIEATFFGKDYSIYEILLRIIACIGTLLVSLDASTDHHNHKKIYKLYGIFVTSLSALCLAGILVILMKIQEENFGRTSRSTALGLTILLCVSFLFKEIVLPTLFQWGIIATIGIITTMGVLLIIRSIQLEGAGKNSFYISSYIACGCISKHVLGLPQRGMALWGSIITLLCLLVHVLVTGIEKKVITSNRGYRLRTTTTLEMVEFRSEANL